jgi:anti-sigma regulatory factor (Ser/Thr protein kinase)
VAVRVFPGLAGQAREARRWVRALGSYRGGLDPDVAELAVAELFANAVLHTRSGDEGGKVTVAVTADGVIHVHDYGTAGPCPGLAAGPPAEGDPREDFGHGLQIVAALGTGPAHLPAAWCPAAGPDDPAVEAGGCCTCCRLAPLPQAAPGAAAQEKETGQSGSDCRSGRKQHPVTITSTTPAEALSGHKFPGPAAVRAEAFWWHLAALREAPTRERAAHHAQSLASAADHIAAALAGTPDAAPDTHRDPLAWTDIATYLTRLALALHGGHMSPDDMRETPGGEGEDWKNLALAVTRREFAAAWQPIRQNLLELAALPGGDGGPRLRAFTAAQVTRAAAAVVDAPW